jgi:Zn-dependent peptidase ImmA (M78 family)
MKRSRKAVEERARQVLAETGTARVPVPLELVAQALDVSLTQLPTGDEVSGVLAIDKDWASIAYNPAHPRVRQRFTIAHELGHFVLHHTDDGLFIDKGYAVMERAKIPRGSDLREIEANQFAAALLMPADLLKQELEHAGLDLATEEGLDQLAAQFGVSRTAMTYRIAQLGLL